MKLEGKKLTTEQKKKLVAGIQLIIMFWYLLRLIHKESSVNQAEQDRERKMERKQKEKLQKLVFHGEIARLKQENKNRLRQLKQDRI